MIVQTEDKTIAVTRMLDAMNAILANIGIDHAYDHFPADYDDAPMLPYIVWTYDVENFYADNVIYYQHYIITLTLYEAVRDDTVEGAVDAALSAQYATKMIDYDVDSALFTITYTFALGGDTHD